MYPLHQNDTGSFQELAHASDIEFGQLSLLTINPGCLRGGHYHTRKREWFCCIYGRCTLELVNVQNGASRTITLDEGSREFVEVGPYWRHAVVNTDETMEVCKVLIIASTEYDSNNDDTYKYEEEQGVLII